MQSLGTEHYFLEKGRERLGNFLGRDIFSSTIGCVYSFLVGNSLSNTGTGRY